MSTSAITPKGIDDADQPDLVLTDGAEPPAEPEWGWLKATLPVALIAAFAELGLAVINNEFQVYIPKGLGLSMIVMTWVMVPFFVSEVVFKSPLGVLADRWGRKPLMVIGPAISIATPLILAAITYPPHRIVLPLLFLFGLLRMLDGLGAASLWPAMFAYIGDHVPQRKRTSAMSVLNVTYMIGMALGFLVGGWVNDTFGPVLTGQSTMKSALAGAFTTMRRSVNHKITQFHSTHSMHIADAWNRSHEHINLLVKAGKATGLSTVINHPAQFHPSFYLGSVLFAIATCVAILALNDKRPASIAMVSAEGDNASTPKETITWAGFLEAIKCVPHLMLIALITFTGMGCIMLLVKNFALDELGVSETQFGLLILWPALIIGALAVPLGHVSDKVGSVLAIKVGFCVGAIGMWLLVLLYGSPKTLDMGLILGASLLGIGFIIAFPAWMSLLTSIGNQSHRGTIVGAVSTAQGVGAVIGAALGGWLYDHGGRLCVIVARLFGNSIDNTSHLSHITPFAASGIFLAVSAGLTILMIKPLSNASKN